MTNHTEIARQMLKAEQNQRLNPGLSDYLDDIDRMCGYYYDGNLRSRQVIALAIKQWQTENKAAQPLVTVK